MVTGIFGVTGNTSTHLSRICIYWREHQMESLMGLKLLSSFTLFVYPTFSFSSWNKLWGLFFKKTSIILQTQLSHSLFFNSIMPSRPIHVDANDRIFLFYCLIIWYCRYTMFSLSIHPSLTDIYVVSVL